MLCKGRRSRLAASAAVTSVVLLAIAGCSGSGASASPAGSGAGRSSSTHGTAASTAAPTVGGSESLFAADAPTKAPAELWNTPAQEWSSDGTPDGVWSALGGDLIIGLVQASQDQDSMTIALLAVDARTGKEAYSLKIPAGLQAGCAASSGEQLYVAAGPNAADTSAGEVTTLFAYTAGSATPAWQASIHAAKCQGLMVTDTSVALQTAYSDQIGVDGAPAGDSWVEYARDGGSFEKTVSGVPVPAVGSWNHDTNGTSSQPAWGPVDGAYAWDGSQYDPSGKSVFSTLGEAACGWTDHQIVTADVGGSSVTVTALDRSTEAQLWTGTWDACVSATANGEVLVVDGGGLDALDAATGKTRWNVSVPTSFTGDAGDMSGGSGTHIPMIAGGLLIFTDSGAVSVMG